MSTIALIPIKPDLHPDLRARAAELAARLDCETQLRICPEVGDGRPFSAHVAARNAMLDLFLRADHTHVLWIDADVTDYDPVLPIQLRAVDPFGIVAPFVLIEGGARFYDTLGFVDSEGNRAMRDAPYFAGAADLIPMRSVGTCYLAPASLYRAGARYAPTEGETEHWSVCEVARARGMAITAVRSLTVAHAKLYHYGEAWHTRAVGA